MKISKYPRTRSAFALMASVVLSLTAQAQTSYFTNTAGGDWNVAANWDRDFLGENVIPAEATNAVINSIGASVVDYTSPMAATSFGSLTVDGGATLNINAAGFKQDLGGVGTAPLTLGSGIVNVGSSGVWTATNGGAITLNSGGALNLGGSMTVIPLSTATPGLAVNLGGVLTVNSGGALTIQDAATTVLAAGSLVTNNSAILFTNTGPISLPNVASPVNILTLNAGSALTMTNTPGSAGINVGSANHASQGAIMTIDGGTLNLDKLLTVTGGGSRVFLINGTLNCFGNSRINDTSNDGGQRIEVRNGTANLGNFSIYRTSSAGGLLVSNGVVNATGVQIGTGNSASYATIYGGVLTNTGPFTISDRTNAAVSSDRRPRLLIRGGTVVSTHAAGIIVANQANTTLTSGSYGNAGSLAGILDINSGTLIAEGITLVKDNTLTNAHAQMTLTSSGTIYLGSVGLNANVGPINSSYSLTLSGGTLGAKANYTANANGTMSGIFTVQAADPANNPFNIINSATWGGSGSLRKTGGGSLTFTANNTFSGATIIDGGTLALSGSGALANSPSITLASGATFDVSAATASYTLALGRTIAGFGNVVGNFTNASGSTINPGSNTVAGTLTFTGSLNQSGGAINHFDLPTTPGPGNDRINITGDLNVSGVNTIEVIGGGSPGTVHTLFGYSGAFNGSLANFVLAGASGSLSNDVATKTIALTIASAVRNPTNVVWLGNVTSNNWDSVNLTNWLHAGDSSLTYFVAGDNVLFDNTGIANDQVNLVGNNAPATLTVGASGDYTFDGTGAVSGTSGLTKTNSGTLSIKNVNSYSGATTISGGVLEAATLANGNNNSSIGSSGPGSANLVIDGATFRYTGSTVSTDRGATLNAGATVGVSTLGSVLTLSGTVTGAGGLTKTGAGTLALNNANNFTGGSIINGGTLQAGNATALGNDGITNNGATLRIQSALTISSIVEWNGNTALELSGVGAGNAALRGASVGSGTVNIYFTTATANQTLTLGGAGNGGGHMWDFSGTVDFNTNSGFLRINNDNATFNFGSSNATFNVGTGTGTLNQRNGSTTTHFGALNGGPTTTLAGRGNTGSGGTTTYSIGGKNVDCTFEGAINNGSGTTAITKVGNAKFTVSGTGIHTGATSIESGAMQIDGSYGSSGITVLSGATLQGNGTLDGTLDVQFGATLAPGASIGVLGGAGLATLNGTTVIELDKANGTNDQFRATGGITYGGDLIVTNLGGALAVGDVFKIFDSTIYSGVFSTITLPSGIPTGAIWNLDNLALDGTIRVTGPTLNVVNNVTSLDFSWTGSYKLQAQTNSLSTGLGNVWFDYPGGGTSPVSVPVNPANGAAFFRLSTP